MSNFEPNSQSDFEQTMHYIRGMLYACHNTSLHERDEEMLNLLLNRLRKLYYNVKNGRDKNDT